MKHEKTLKREDGSKVNISVSFYSDNFSNHVRYSVSVSVCEPKKRTFKYVNDTDNFTWRRLSQPEREAMQMRLNLKYVTPDEIQQTALELWEKIKPNLL